MVKEKLGIVSSYNELCGNASYTKALADGLSKHYNVSIVPLNVDLLRKGEKYGAELHIKEICQQLKAFDCVNVQFEAGLFGSDLSSILRHFRAIGRSCNRLVLTMHRYHAKEKYPSLKMLVKAMLRKELKFSMGAMQFAYANNRYLPLYNKVINFCKKNKASIVVHTPRESELIKTVCGFDRVYDHPLCFYEQSSIASLKESYSKDKFCEEFSLDKNKKYIGIFGFINRYKGHETAIKALETLPLEYELLIFGSQHPHTINLEEALNPYIGSLLKLIDKKGLKQRVKFYGSLNDTIFLKALIGCDFTALPYLEVNQGGSAIAALALEVGAKSLFSQNKAFIELSKYAPDCFRMFTIGNYLELSNAILSHSLSDYSSALEEYHSKYNINTSVELYRKLLSENK